MQAVWKGYLQCSLVTIPLRMFNAVAKSSLQFHLYHQEGGSRIHREMSGPALTQPGSDAVVGGGGVAW